MKVDFNFGQTAEITLTPESPREESLVRMCFDEGNPVVTRNVINKTRIQFIPPVGTCPLMTLPVEFEDK